MGAKTKTVGGSKGGMSLSDDFMTVMGQLLNGGQTGRPAGTGAVDSTKGVAGVLNDVLSGGGGNMGGALAKLLEKSQERNVNNLRGRFGASGGMAFGTPAAHAEAVYRAEAAPQIATQVGEMQLKALSPLLGLYGGITDKNTPQAQTVQEKSAFSQVLDVAGQLAPVAANFFTPGLGAGSTRRSPGNRTQMDG
jgi:hypothetical protein